jgi:hypothetical protein
VQLRFFANRLAHKAQASKETQEMSDTVSVAASSSHASTDCACSCHTHQLFDEPSFLLTEEWIANHDDREDTSMDVLGSVLDSLIYKVDSSSNSSSSSGSSSSSFSGQIEASLHRTPAALQAVKDARGSEEGLAFLAQNLHEAQIMKGLASVQLKKAITILRLRIRELKIHELLYNQALSTADQETIDQVCHIDQHARTKALAGEFFRLSYPCC